MMERAFSDPDGEVSRRDRRGRRGVLGGGKRDLHRSRFQQLPWSTESVSLKITPKKGYRAWNLPTPIGWSKTSPRPLREALRIRMGKPGLLFSLTNLLLARQKCLILAAPLIGNLNSSQVDHVVSASFPGSSLAGDDLRSSHQRPDYGVPTQ